MNERVAALTLEVRRLEGEQELRLADANHTHARAAAAEAAAVDIEKAKIAAGSAVVVEKHKARGATRIEGVKGIFALGAALLTGMLAGSKLTNAKQGNRAVAETVASPAHDTPVQSALADVWRQYASDEERIRELRRAAENFHQASVDVACATLGIWGTNDARVCLNLMRPPHAIFTIDTNVTVDTISDARGIYKIPRAASDLGTALSIDLLWDPQSRESHIVVNNPRYGSLVLAPSKRCVSP